MERWETVVDPVDGTRWKVDVGFLESQWTCLWGNGCQGILDQRTPERGEGCCSVGAELVSVDEAKTISALGSSLDPARFENHATATDNGVLSGDPVPSTRVVNGACIFFNRPGFKGGAGCALHLAALDAEELPLDWKPSVCWQMPFKVDRAVDGSRTLRRWSRSDWGTDELQWWCCEPNVEAGQGPSAYVGESRVVDSMFDELVGLVGTEVAVQLRSGCSPL